MRTQLATAVVLGILLGLAMALGPSAISADQMGPDRFDFAELLAGLENGAVRRGSGHAASMGNCKPIAEVTRRSVDGAHAYLMSAFYFDSKILVLYSKDQELFAAQFIEGIRRSRERWFFCDMEILEDYMAIAVDRDDVDQPGHQPPR